MRVLVGTSGYSYKEWKGPFYPKEVPASGFLRYFAERLPTVEINNTFYRMPTAKLVDGWLGEVPPTFTFAVKAPQRITHIAKLLDAKETTEAFVRVVDRLGGAPRPAALSAAAVLAQGRAAARGVPARRPRRATASRSSSGTRRGSTTRCGARCARTALRSAWRRARRSRPRSWRRPTGGTCACARTSTPTPSCRRGRTKIRAQPWKEAFVYVKHDEGDAPSVAKRLTEMLG